MPASRYILVEVMPAHLRASHEAAGNPGSYPDNGAERMILTEDDARAAARGPGTRIVRRCRRGDRENYGGVSTFETWARLASGR